MDSNYLPSRPIGNLFGEGMDCGAEDRLQTFESLRERRKAILCSLDNAISTLQEETDSTQIVQDFPPPLTSPLGCQMQQSEKISLKLKVEVAANDVVHPESIWQIAKETQKHEALANKLLSIANSRTGSKEQAGKNFEKTLNRSAIRELFVMLLRRNVRILRMAGSNGQQLFRLNETERNRQTLYEFLDVCTTPNSAEIMLLARFTSQSATSVLKFFIAERAKIEHLTLRQALTLHPEVFQALRKRVTEN